MEKKQRQQDKVADEWRHQADDLQSELDAAQRESRVQAGESHRLQIGICFFMGFFGMG